MKSWKEKLQLSGNYSVYIYMTLGYFIIRYKFDESCNSGQRCELECGQCWVLPNRKHYLTSQKVSFCPGGIIIASYKVSENMFAPAFQK